MSDYKFQVPALQEAAEIPNHDRKALGEKIGELQSAGNGPRDFPFSENECAFYDMSG